MLYDLIKTSLDVSKVRENVITNNIANVNTKNFKRSDVKFEEYLNKSSFNIGFKTTNERHISGQSNYYRVIENKATSIRTDGNNVDIDMEKANQAANNLMYNTLVTGLNNQYELFSSVLRGGR